MISTLAYNTAVLITTVKSFIELASGVNLIKHFWTISSQKNVLLYKAQAN